jgi:hypothetical protein
MFSYRQTQVQPDRLTVMLIRIKADFNICPDMNIPVRMMTAWLSLQRLADYIPDRQRLHLYSHWYNGHSW